MLCYRSIRGVSFVPVCSITHHNTYAKLKSCETILAKGFLALTRRLGCDFVSCRGDTPTLLRRLDLTTQIILRHVVSLAEARLIYIGRSATTPTRRADQIAVTGGPSICTISTCEQRLANSLQVRTEPGRAEYCRFSLDTEGAYTLSVVGVGVQQ